MATISLEKPLYVGDFIKTTSFITVEKRSEILNNKYCSLSGYSDGIRNIKFSGTKNVKSISLSMNGQLFCKYENNDNDDNFSMKHFTDFDCLLAGRSIFTQFSLFIESDEEICITMNCEYIRVHDQFTCDSLINSYQWFPDIGVGLIYSGGGCFPVKGEPYVYLSKNSGSKHKYSYNVKKFKTVVKSILGQIPVISTEKINIDENYYKNNLNCVFERLENNYRAREDYVKSLF